MNDMKQPGRLVSLLIRLSQWQFAPLVCLVLLVSIGTLGYVAIEDMSFLDGLYMTVITLTTVGYREVKHPSPVGQVFTIGLIVFGVSTAAWLAGVLLESVVSEEYQSKRRQRHMQKRLDHLSDHFIVCGYGRIGHEVARFLSVRQLAYAVIEPESSRVAVALAEGVLLVQGNAHDDETLRAVGIERAKGLIAAMASDAENIFIVLSARELNPKLFIVARAAQQDVIRKLERAGANRVISPYVMGGRSMGAAVALPTVSAFLDSITHSERSEIELMEVTVAEGSSLAGQALKDLDIHGKTGAVILVKRSPDGKITPPSFLDAGDTLVAVGTPEQLERLQGML